MLLHERDLCTTMAGENHQQRKPRKQLIIMLCLLLILVGSGIFLFARSRNQGSDTPQRLHTSATKRSVSRSSPTTPTHTALPLPSLTPTPQPLFFDYFLDNSKGWLTSNVSGYTRTVDESGLYLSDTNHKILVESLPANTMFDNFTLTTTFTFQRGDAHDSMGLYLRGDNNLDHDYRIDIYGNNTYAISKEALDGNNKQITTVLAGPTHATALKQPGRENTLTVTMVSTMMVLSINGVTVSVINDADYTHGQIALFVQNGMTSDGVDALFSSIMVNRILVEATPSPTTTP
jgi:hypothetical protein